LHSKTAASIAASAVSAMITQPIGARRGVAECKYNPAVAAGPSSSFDRRW
jgi:hypothetical protein